MSTSGKSSRPAPLGEKALREFLSLAIEQGYYRESQHAEKDHPERNISVDDVVHGLEHPDWKFERKPVWDTEHQEWKYYIDTTNIEGDRLVVVLKIMPQYKRFEVITRW
jgi:hypothetical protein